MRAIRLVGMLLGGVIGVLVAAAAITKIRHPSSGGPDSDELDLATIWGGTDFASEAPSFCCAELLTWWGGTRLDLRRATLDPMGATIATRTLFGGTEIVVPAGWEVRLAVRTIAGGAEGPGDAGLIDGGGPYLTVTGWVAFGGLSVKVAPDEP